MTDQINPAGIGGAAPPNSAVDGAAILANARAIAPILREEAAESERRRRLTPGAVQALRSTGVFGMSVPQAWGGPELDPLVQIEIIEELSYADGSAGWCAMIGSDSGFFSARLDDTVAKRLYPNMNAITAGAIAPPGQLHEVDGGFRLKGHWHFGSGCNHADVIAAGAFVFRNGEIALGQDQRPDFRMAVLTADAFELLDSWDTIGLRGTGSHEFRIADTFVPAEQTFRFREPRRAGALYAWPGLFIANTAGVPLGIGRAALEATEQLLVAKVLVPEQRPARDEPSIQAALAQAHSLVGSARSYAFEVIGDLWSTSLAGNEPSNRQRAAVAGCIRHAIRSCLEAVRMLVDTVGSASIFRSSPLDRPQRDLTAMAQHIVGQSRLAALEGSLWLDAPSEHPLIADKIV